MSQLVHADVRAIFFDAVGTLIHPEPPAPVAYAEVAHRHGSRRDLPTIASRFRSALQAEEGIDRNDGWRTSEAREVARWRRIVATVLDDVDAPEECFEALFTHFSGPQAWRTDPDAALVLPALAKEGYALGVASNYDHRLRTIAAGTPEFAHFSHYAVSAEIGWRKPAAEFFAVLCEQARHDAAHVLLVGDDLVNDYEGARAAGLHAVLVDPGDRFPSRLRIRRLRELLA